MEWTIERLEILLLIAALVAMAAQKLRVPYTIGLVAAGAVLAVTRYVPGLELTQELIFTAFLPPLVFEAAFDIQWPALRRDLFPTLVLASVGVALSAAVVAVGMHYLVGWEWTAAALFGSLIAATDPVSVIALFKEANLHGRLRLPVESESLLNDGVAVVLFGVILAATRGDPLRVLGAPLDLSLLGVIANLAVTIIGGLLCGALVGWGVILLAGRTEDHLVEITFTTVAAYGSFLLAEHFHVSGVLATLTTGLLLGNVGTLGAISDRGREAVVSFWEYAAFVANSLVFLLIGVREAREEFLGVLTPLLVAIVLVTASRAAAVYPLSALFNRTRWRIDPRHQHILFWGGLRGALALALVLGLPPDTPQRSAITAVAFGVVAFSIVVQGITMPPLLRRLGLLGRQPGDARPANASEGHGSGH